jgi:hypothetical protein
MRRYHLTTMALVGVSLVVLAELAPEAVGATAAEAQTPTIAPGMARVWFLRPAGSLNGNVWAAAPMIYANGAPIGDISAGSEFYRDFRPGTYRAVLRSANRSGRHRTAGTWDAGLSRNPVAGQLGGGLSGGGLGVRAEYFRYPDDVASAGTGLSSDIDLSPEIITGARETVK